MSVTLGIDLGTSSLKAMLLDLEKGVIAVHAKSYEVSIPRPGFAEQDPAVWWESLKEVLAKLRVTAPKAFSSIAAIGFSGQMHGLVLTGQDQKPVRPAILWLDQRSSKQVGSVREQISPEQMGQILCNQVSSGFAFPSLLWVKENEPEIFAKSCTVLCPKDYLRLKMTGQVGAEAVDASSTGMFNVSQRDWAWNLLEQFALPARLFPPVHESWEVAGVVCASCAEETGLGEGIPVIYGSGDQPAQAIGNGAIRPGQLICNIGTGGQISAFLEEPLYDPLLRTNTFCHAVNRGYTIFGATLCSGMSMNWAKNKLFHIDGYEQINTEAAAAAPGSQGLLYLPYLSGERTPHLDPDASGMFFGMRLFHERGHFLRAVMEGVIYSLRECLDLLESLGVSADTIIASGGGAASPLWLQIQADILRKPVQASKVREQACLGACMLAAHGCGLEGSLDEWISRFAVLDEQVYLPDPKNEEVYAAGYDKYRQLYGRTKDLM